MPDKNECGVSLPALHSSDPAWSAARFIEAFGRAEFERERYSLAPCACDDPFCKGWQVVFPRQGPSLPTGGGGRLTVLARLHVEHVCFGTGGAAWCAYLVQDSEAHTYECAKESPQLLAQIRDGRTRRPGWISRGDNCSGAPAYEPTPGRRIL